MMKRWCLILLVSLFSQGITAQNMFGLINGAGDENCRECQETISARPKEVLFGIHLREGNVYFSISSETWFNKIIKNASDGIGADLVSKDQFLCDKEIKEKTGWSIGTLMRPMYLPEIKKVMTRTAQGGLQIKLGPIPENLSEKELEGNLVIVRNHKVCFYTNFTNIDRNLWDLLDMGLYTDSLINKERLSGASASSNDIFFSRKCVVSVPFQKGKATYSPRDVKPLYDSLNLKGYKVKKITIRAFSSVEGPYSTNLQLQQKRAQGILNAIQSYQKESIQKEVSSGENWVEFVQSISNTPFNYLKELSKEEVKKRLMSKPLLDSLEPFLATQRKAIITIFLSDKGKADNISNKDLVSSFQSALSAKDIDKAAAIQQSIFERIHDKKLPADYLGEIEIPADKQYSRLLNNRQAYKYLLKAISEDEAIEQLKKIEALDPNNARVKYNICALQMRLWQFNEKQVNKDEFLKDIQSLPRLGIPKALVNRMLINYQILLSEIYMKQQNYAAKDKVLEELKERYIDRSLSDEDLLSLGKYFCWYAQYTWADDIIRPRMNKLDVSEDLLFFYLNLCIFNSVDFTDETHSRILLNAISINTQRFCRFFNSIHKGGISMQLLLNPFWKEKYCENCNLFRLQ